MDVKLLLLTLMLFSTLLLLIFAFGGPSSGAAKARRLQAVNLRHGGGGDLLVETQLRKSIAAKRAKANEKRFSFMPDSRQLARRLSMTGKKWPLDKYMMVCVGLSVVVALLGFLKGFPPLAALFVGTAVGLGGPHLYVSRLIDKRVKSFVTLFPDALELMVRGLRSGLPIAETIGIVGGEIEGAVGEEFRLVTERIRIGNTMDQAFQETANRLGTPEFQFFCITIAIQRETGGNLAETLANLAKVLRARAQMKLKVRAMSSEAKASAYIIGALPFCVFGLLMVMNPSYMGQFLIGNPAGLFGLSSLQVAGVGGLIWMGIGAYIMKQMISFEI